MNKQYPAIGLILVLATVFLAACTRQSALEIGVRGRLAACGLKGTPFEKEPFANWATLYNTKMNSVLTADLESLKTRSCVLSSSGQGAPPTKELLDLAKTLPPWKVPSSLAALSQEDLVPVLLEYLRTYECAMLEYRETVSLTAASGSTNRGDTNKMVYEAKDKIQRELAYSRTSLHRTLAIVSGLHRLELLAMDTNCLTRISLDLRNDLALLSEVGACLPRTHDGRQSLRDLSTDPY